MELCCMKGLHIKKKHIAGAESTDKSGPLSEKIECSKEPTCSDSVSEPKPKSFFSSVDRFMHSLIGGRAHL